MKHSSKLYNTMWSSVKVIKGLPKFLIISWVILCFSNAFSFILQMIFIEEFINNIEYYLIDKIPFFEILKSGCAVLLCLSLSYILSALSAWEDEVLEATALSYLTAEFNKLIARTSAEKFNDIEFLNKIEKAKKGMKNSVYVGQVVLFILSWHVPYFIYLSIYLYNIKPVFLVILLLSLFLTSLSYLLQMRYSYKHENVITLVERKMQYYNSSFIETNLFKELRVKSAFGFMKKKLDKAIEDYNDLNLEYEKKSLILELVNKIAITSGYIIIILMLFYNISIGEITFGEFGVILISIGRIFTMARSIVFSNLGYAAKNSGAIMHYIDFLQFLPSCKSTAELPSNIQSIEFDRVSYLYPNAKEYAIKDISLKIMKNDFIAVVGLNGSGKSTFAKLILGLYEPTSGSVLYSEGSGEHKNYATSLLQDFCRYEATLENNVQISDINLFLKSQKNHVDIGNLFEGEISEKWDEYLKNYAHIISSLDLSIDKDVILSTKFGGIDLSGGQWQRISYARAMYRDSSVVVLDEPTSAIDPLEENNMYQQFGSLLGKKTTILVTHRIGTVALANRIIVFNKGSIVGDGTHNELIRDCSTYKQLWESQSEMY